MMCKKNFTKYSDIPYLQNELKQIELIMPYFNIIRFVPQHSSELDYTCAETFYRSEMSIVHVQYNSEQFFDKFSINIRNKSLYYVCELVFSVFNSF